MIWFCTVSLYFVINFQGSYGVMMHITFGNAMNFLFDMQMDLNLNVRLDWQVTNPSLLNGFKTGWWNL